MGTPGPEHFIFIPGVLMIGAVFGFVMGSRAAHVLVALLCGPDPLGTRLRGEAALYRRLAHRT